MRVRLIALAVMALVGLTAFAPAPFMKTDRHKGNGDALTAMQGTWTLTEKSRMGPNGQLMNYATRQKVEISEDSWQFVSTLGMKGGKGGGVGGGGIAAKGGFGGKGGGGKTSISYKLVVDGKRQPTEFRVKRTGGFGGKLGNLDSDYMIGIVQVRGDTMKMLYRLGSRSDVVEATPRDFNTVPEGWYSMTLTREK